MITKFKYNVNTKGIVERKPTYTFTPIEELTSRLQGVSDASVISSISEVTLSGETERELIGIEDNWFKTQTLIQNMLDEREKLTASISTGDKSNNPLSQETQNKIQARIKELSPGTITIKKVFYDHYTRQTMNVEDTIQTPFTVAIETRAEIESRYPHLSGFRGVVSSPIRPQPKLSLEKEKEIKKEIIRQKINSVVGDDKDLIADLSNAVSALFNKVSGNSLSSAEEAYITKYLARQKQISTIIVDAAYKK